MALPTLVKTWQFNVNNTAISAEEVLFYQGLLFDIKTAMVGFASNPWAVKSSCDSVAFGVNDNIDRWNVSTDLVWSTGNHSWIVLENADGFQICFASDFSTAQVEDLLMFASPSAGFTTGGSLSARPTASDEYDIHTGQDANAWFSNQTGTIGNNVWHLWHSTDGTLTYMVGMRSNKPHTLWALGAIGGPITGFTNPYLGSAYTGNNVVANFLTVSNLSDVTNLRSEHGGVRMELYATGAGMVNANIVESSALSVPEEISGALFLPEMGLVSPTVGVRGVKGKLIDMFWGQYQVAVSGDTYPNNAALRDFVQLGHIVLPWTGDATVPQTS